MVYRVFAILFFLLLINTSKAQSWLWGAQGKDGGCNSFCVASDNKGNAYITGYLASQSMIFGADTVTKPISNPFTAATMYLVKYDSLGNIKWVWQPVCRSTGGMDPVGVTTDANGFVYITGTITDTVKVGSFVLYGNNVFIAKFDPLGNVIWAKQSQPANNLPAATQGGGITVDKYGNSYITGGFISNIKFGSYTLNISSGGWVGLNQNSFLVKYDPLGNVIWAQQTMAAANNSSGYSYNIQCDTEGNVAICGSYIGSIKLGSVILNSVGYPYMGDGFIAMYDKNGNVLWATSTNSLNANSYCWNNALVIDKSGSIYCTGMLAGNVKFGGDTLNTPTINSLPQQNAFFCKYTHSGSCLWTQQAAPVNYSTVGRSLAIDERHQIYLSGMADVWNQLYFCKDTFPLFFYPATSELGMLIKIDTLGQAHCGSIIVSGGNWNQAACSPNGKYVYLTGDVGYPILFNQDTVNSEGDYPPFLARWQPCEYYTGGSTAAQSDSCPTQLTIPNIFTPNQDGINDLLTFSQNALNTLSIRIYNRWGEIVFSGSQAGEFWNGRHLNTGNNTPEGVYYYIIQAACNGKDYLQKGFVELIR